MTRVGKDVEKLAPSCTVGGTENRPSGRGNGITVSQKIKHRTTIGPGKSVSGRTKRNESRTPTDSCASMPTEQRTRNRPTVEAVQVPLDG